MATVETPVEAATVQRFRLWDVDWQAYCAIAQALDERHVRLTYDRGGLELMTLSHGHERLSKLLGQFIEILTDELNLPRQSGGSTTLQREDVERAIEPDQCYYLENEPQVRGMDEIDLTIVPPPDLAIEVDVTRSSLNRMGIYAALGVPEVWRFDGEDLRCYRLTTEKAYAESAGSRYFPRLSLAEVQSFLGRRSQMDETSLIRSFRTWVREQIAQGWPASTSKEN